MEFLYLQLIFKTTVMGKLKFLICLLAVTSMCIAVCAQEKNDAWDYPVKPGMEEWENLKTSSEMLEICQIPSDVLIKLPTEDLLKICIKYPLLINIISANNLQQGFENTTKYFNGLNELLSRHDIGNELMKSYKQLDLETNHIKGFDFKFDLVSIGFLELFISQNSILDQLNKTQKEELLKESIKKLGQKQALGNSLYRQKTTGLILSRILDRNEQNQPGEDLIETERFKIFNQYVILSDSSLINEVKNQAEIFLNNY